MAPLVPLEPSAALSPSGGSSSRYGRVMLEWLPLRIRFRMVIATLGLCPSIPHSAPLSLAFPLYIPHSTSLTPQPSLSISLNSPHPSLPIPHSTSLTPHSPTTPLPQRRRRARQRLPAVQLRQRLRRLRYPVRGRISSDLGRCWSLTAAAATCRYTRLRLQRYVRLVRRWDVR